LQEEVFVKLHQQRGVIYLGWTIKSSHLEVDGQPLMGQIGLGI